MIGKRFCLGTAQFGMNYGIANRSGQPSRHAVRAMVAAALERGTVYFDTAQAYGQSEEVLGDVLQGLGVADQVRVVTKLHPGFEFRQPEQLRRAVIDSLDRLHCTSLYGLLLHRAELRGDLGGFLREVATLKELGTIRFFGVSVYTPEEALRWLDGPGIDLMQIPFNALDRRWFDRGIVERARASGVRLFVRSVFLQGLLLMDPARLEDAGMTWAAGAVDYLARRASAANCDRALYAFKLVLQSCPDAVLVMGVDSLAQLEQNLSGFCATPLAQAAVEKWWRNLPAFDEKILNPSLWNQG